MLPMHFRYHLLLLEIVHVLPAADASFFGVPRLRNVIAERVEEQLGRAVGVND